MPFKYKLLYISNINFVGQKSMNILGLLMALNQVMYGHHCCSFLNQSLLQLPHDGVNTIDIWSSLSMNWEPFTCKARVLAIRSGRNIYIYTVDFYQDVQLYITRTLLFIL